MQRFLKLPKGSPGGLSVEEFRTVYNGMLERLPTLKDSFKDRRVGIAVSGGADSLALAILASKVIPRSQLVALMVDHQLGSQGVSEDPQKVAQLMSSLGIPHETIPLAWDGVFWDALTKGKMMEKTRELRYEAILKACRRLDIPLVLTGHNLDDDLVTMFYRVAHLSGIDGLAGMKAVTAIPVYTSPMASRVIVGHPLLAVPKGRLMETCREAQMTWTHDASNEDLDFRRNSIQSCLAAIQKENPALTTEALQRTLNNFKAIRVDLHEQMARIFDRSVIVNKINGDCTLILNDRDWLSQKHLVTRLLATLIQYAGADRYQPRTKAIERLYQALMEAYEEHEADQKAWLNKLPSTVNKGDLQPIDKTRRVQMPQFTLGNATFYSLSRTDAMRRIALQERLEGRKLGYGPAFLIQRDPPPRRHHEACLLPVEVTLTKGQSYLWDDRFHLSFEHTSSMANPNPTGSRTFQISFMTPGDVKAFEALTAADRPARRRMYAYMGVTPGTHLYQIPVVREVGSDYMAFPTLQADFPQGKYKWKTSYAGLRHLVSRFLCLP